MRGKGGREGGGGGNQKGAYLDARELEVTSYLGLVHTMFSI